MTKLSGNELSYCVKEKKPCVGWVDKYFQDCLCNLRDNFSFAFGVISLICWAAAEIPQIVTNFRTKSSHGVSLLFLLTWVAGDVFNLVGCFLEPATLPTQLYTALLYTATTIILVLQTLYYDHFHRLQKYPISPAKDNQTGEERQPLIPKSRDSREGNADLLSVASGQQPRASRRPDFYYTSARSLAGSSTPPFRSYLRGARSGPTAMELDNGSTSSEDEQGPLLSKNTISQPKPIPWPVKYGGFISTTSYFPPQANALLVGFSGRKLLSEGGGEHSAFGQWLGWLMAAIYMGGRIPQILLNIRRGSVEGLNPLMFIFALVANVTYVGSILARTTKWVKIKANMPWLLDAVVCVALDAFIILQYIYFKYVGKGKTSKDVVSVGSKKRRKGVDVSREKELSREFK